MEDFKKQQQELQEQYDDLRSLVEYHANLYYKEGRSEIPDSVYDTLFAELRAMEAEHPWLNPEQKGITNGVGDDSTAGFARAKHDVPMLSIEDVFEKKDENAYVELDEAVERIMKLLPEGSAFRFAVEPKIDGCAASAVYRNGTLAQLLTRGDGQYGDDIIRHAPNIAGLPAEIGTITADKLIVRGELVITKKEFDRINEEQDKMGKQRFANARNLTAGTIKSLDQQATKDRKVTFIPHGLIFFNRQHGDDDDYNALDAMKFLLSTGFNPVTVMQASSMYTLRECVQYIDMKRKDGSFDYELDGAVIKVWTYRMRDKLGATSHAPRWAVAMKYLPDQVETVVKDITIQVGRTGVLCPVAELEPVQLAGSVVKRATLHNQDEITRKDVRIGDTVVIEKAGEIIPAVVRVVKNKRPADTEPYDILLALGGVCPCCGQPVERTEEAAIRCTNPECQAGIVASIVHMCSRKCLDIQSVGPKLAEALVKTFEFKCAHELLLKTKDELALVPFGNSVLGMVRAEKLVAEIGKAKLKPLHCWLASLGIRTLGQTASWKVSENVQTFSGVYKFMDDMDYFQQRADALLQSKAERSLNNLVCELKSTYRIDWDGSSPLKLPAPHGWCKAFLDYCNTRKNFKIVCDILSKLGIDPKSDRYMQNANIAEGADALTFVFTGTLSQSRDHFAHLAKMSGHKVSGAISKNTSYLVCGVGGGSKRSKAEALGVPQITEEEFLRLINA